MASFDVKGLDGLLLSMTEISQIPEDVQDQMLNAQADIVVRAQQEKARAYGVQKTGLLISSIKKGKVKATKTGRAIYVYPQGSRTRSGKKTRNAEIAFVAEYGRPKKQKARPFIRDANETSAEETTQAGAMVYDQFLKSKNL